MLLDPDLYFPNRFQFEETPQSGLLLMWQRPNCLYPPDVVSSAINKGIRLAHHVDIRVAHWRAAADLDWLDWLIGELGGLSLPRIMHVEAIVWAALAMQVGGGYLDPSYWKCWRRSPAKRVRIKLGASGTRILRSEPWGDLKCFHAGGEVKKWLQSVRGFGAARWPRHAFCARPHVSVYWRLTPRRRYARERALEAGAAIVRLLPHISFRVSPCANLYCRRARFEELRRQRTIIPVHYFRLLRSLGVESWMVVHARTQNELIDLFPDDLDRILFVPDLWIHKFINNLSGYLPHRLSVATLGLLNQLITQFCQRSIVRRLIRDERINVIHQPIPVAPRFPSVLYGLGVPVVIGPLNGGMEYPPAFRRSEPWIVRAGIGAAGLFVNVVNALLPGKRLADVVLVANERTRLALPSGIRGKLIELVENGIDFSVWQGTSANAEGLQPLALLLSSDGLWIGRLWIL